MSSRPLSRAVAKTVQSARPSCRASATRRFTQLRPAARQLHFSSGGPSRPTPRSIAPTASLGPRTSKRSIFIQTEETPNADALKFKPNQRILPESFPSPYVEYISPRSTLAPPHPSPLAAKLLNVDGVTSVFFGQDYITITKDSATQWAHVKPEVFSLITEAVTGGQPIVTISEGKEGEEAVEADSLAYNENDSEVVSMIKELLDTRIRPAIQEDGGDIEFRGFENGMVMVKLRGACRSCDSSTVTLRNGIESMLMHYIEEVTGVQQVFDEEEEVAMREFQKFEERLRQQQGYVPPSTPGKGSLDTAT